MMRKIFLAFGLGAVMAVATPDTAEAQVTVQDGLVNVVVGDVTIAEDVNVAVAASVVAQVCGVKVGPLGVAVLGRADVVDRTSRSMVVCRAEEGDVVIEQN